MQSSGWHFALLTRAFAFPLAVGTMRAVRPMHNGAPLMLHVQGRRWGEALSRTTDVAVDGSMAAPFRSVSEARDALREMQPLPPGGAVVVLHQGLHAPFELDGVMDSGTADAPIV